MPDIYTIYRGILEHAGKIVVRRFRLRAGAVEFTDDVWVAGTLDEARSLVPVGRTCFTRNRDDAPTIIESWL